MKSQSDIKNFLLNQRYNEAKMIKFESKLKKIEDNEKEEKEKMHARHQYKKS